MGLGWLDVKDISINWLLMLQREHIHWITKFCNYEKDLGIVLNEYPYIFWYFINLSPKDKAFFERIKNYIKSNYTENQIRKAEIKVLESINDWLIYVYDPEIYENLSIGKWDDSELEELFDFTGKKVIDIGSGTGRLAFVAAKKAECVYALEPVHNLRKYLREKAKKLHLENFFVIDGRLEKIPLEDNFSDVLLAGHVFGDYPEIEYNEMKRITKNNGEIILFPGNRNIDNDIHKFLTEKTFKWKIFKEPGDGMMRAYWKRNEK